MGGVLIAVKLSQVFGRPPIFPRGSVKKPVVDAVVGVGTMTVHNFAQQALPFHIQEGKVVSPEAPVFKHHARDTRLFRRFCKPPAIVNGQGSRHFNARVNPPLHGINSYRCMRIPIGGDDDRIQLLLVQHLLPGRVVVLINPWILFPGLPALQSRPFSPVAEQVTYCGNFDILHP